MSIAGIATRETLIRLLVSEILEDSKEGMESIHENLTVSERMLRGMKSIFGGLRNVFLRSEDRKIPPQRQPHAPSPHVPLSPEVAALAELSSRTFPLLFADRHMGATRYRACRLVFGSAEEGRLGQMQISVDPSTHAAGRDAEVVAQMQVTDVTEVTVMERPCFFTLQLRVSPTGAAELFVMLT